MQARPKGVLYQLQQSSSPAGTGVMDTPCTLENTQKYTSCGKKGVTGHKDTSQKPRGVTHPQNADVWWSHHCTRAGADHRPCCAQQMLFVTARHILPGDQESNQQGTGKELALSDVPQLHHCRSKAKTQHRRGNPTGTPWSSFKSTFLL